MPEESKLGHAAEAYCPHCERSYPPASNVCPDDGTTLVQFGHQREQLIGKVLADRFEIIGRLGAGGMGTVYRAKQTSVGREVAVKVIDPTLSRDRDTSKRFLREARLASRLSQPNTVVVHDFGQHEGVLFIVMEQLRGKTLRDVLKESGPMPASRIRRIGGQLCDALEAAHTMGVIHRDLKPSNIMILDKPVGRDVVKVLDFGLAKSLVGDTAATSITQSGAVIGTPLYMAPEMIHAEEVDERADLYSLGCILYELATGNPPFIAPTTSALFAKHLTESVQPMDRVDLGPGAVMIERMLQKDVNMRPASAAEVRDALLGETSASDVSTVKRPRTSSMEAAPTMTAASAGRAAAAARAATTATTKRRSWIPIAGALVVLCCAALVWRFGLGGQDGAGEKVPAPVPIAAVNPADAAPAVVEEPKPEPSALAPEAKPEPTKVTVTIDSKPSAYLTIGGVKRGKTPVEYATTPGEKVMLEFRKRGYRTLRRTAVISSDQPIEVELEKRSRTRKPKPDKPKPKPKDAPPDIDFIR